MRLPSSCGSMNADAVKPVLAEVAPRAAESLVGAPVSTTLRGGGRDGRDGRLGEAQTIEDSSKYARRGGVAAQSSAWRAVRSIAASVSPNSHLARGDLAGLLRTTRMRIVMGLVVVFVAVVTWKRIMAGRGRLELKDGGDGALNEQSS